MKYTEKIHAEGLLEIFSADRPCGFCPSKVMRMRLGVDRWDGEWGMVEPQCDLCWEFIGEWPNTNGWFRCPCYRGNQARAAKLTWLALEEKGYLEGP